MTLLLDALNISIVDCGGKGQMDRLFRVFNELGIPCYMLFDYDRHNDDKEIVAKSRELLALAGVAPDEPKTVLIEDRCACFPNKWEDTIESEVDCKQLNAEGKSVFGFSKDSSKPLIARYIATRLTGQKPPVIPPSIAAILQRAVQVSAVRIGVVSGSSRGGRLRLGVVSGSDHEGCGMPMSYGENWLFRAR